MSDVKKQIISGGKRSSNVAVGKARDVKIAIGADESADSCFIQRATFSEIIKYDSNTRKILMDVEDYELNESSRLARMSKISIFVGPGAAIGAAIAWTLSLFFQVFFFP